jgi:hypothetical protein
VNDTEAARHISATVGDEVAHHSMSVISYRIADAILPISTDQAGSPAWNVSEVIGRLNFSFALGELEIWFILYDMITLFVHFAEDGTPEGGGLLASSPIYQFIIVVERKCFVTTL